MNSNKRVFITGVAGFLGSHLARWYLDEGCTVHGVDNFSSSKRTSKHYDALRKRELFSSVDFNICNAGDDQRRDIFPGMIDLITDGLDGHGGYNIVLNFACPASPPIYQRIPIETMLTCTLGTYHVLEGARSSGTNPVVIHASTSEVYGDPETSPQSESYCGRVHSWGKRACYDEGKRAAEALSYDYKHLHDLDVRLVRIFNTYGPNMDIDDGRVVTNFVKQALKNETITVYGDGQQTRSFCYVDDLVAGITGLANLHRGCTPLTPMNLGNPGEFTVLELAQKVLDLIPDSKSTIDFSELPVHDPMQRKPNLSLAHRHLPQWTPRVDLDTGLMKLIEYMRPLVKRT